MKNHLLKLTQYNVWANQKFIQWMNNQEEEILLENIKSSFSNVFETCKHIWFGEAGWLSRMNNMGWKTNEIDNFQGKPKELFESWIKSSNAYVQLVKNEDLDEKISFSHGDMNYSIERTDIILTIINHGNYHRGQIVTMLRQLGITEVPKTDYIEWVREQARNENS